MATTDPLPKAVLQSVAEQLGQLLALPRATVAGTLGELKQPRLTESLVVCFVTAEQVAHPPRDLSVLARPSGIWHHQVRTAGGPTHFARSRQLELKGIDLQVEQWTESPIAAKLDEALAWIDDSLPNDATVRLLVIPSYYVHALLLLRGRKSSVVLVDQPPGFTRLAYRKEYPLGTFLKRLAKETPSASLM
jgi:hypothetical protein